jgi:hypothetical protein
MNTTLAQAPAPAPYKGLYLHFFIQWFRAIGASFTKQAGIIFSIAANNSSIVALVII